LPKPPSAQDLFETIAADLRNEAFTLTLTEAKFLNSRNVVLLSEVSTNIELKSIERLVAACFN
jgi:thymidine kinase